MKDYSKPWLALEKDLVNLEEKGNHPLPPSAVLLLMRKQEQIDDLETMHKDLEDRAQLIHSR